VVIDVQGQEAGRDSQKIKIAHCQTSVVIDLQGRRLA